MAMIFFARHKYKLDQKSENQSETYFFMHQNKKIDIKTFTKLHIYCKILHVFLPSETFRLWHWKFKSEVVFHMPVIKVRENEPFDVALRRFKRSCEKAGILADVRAREFYEKPTTVRKRAKASAIKRHAKKLARENARHTRLY